MPAIHELHNYGGTSLDKKGIQQQQTESDENCCVDDPKKRGEPRAAVISNLGEEAEKKIRRRRKEEKKARISRGSPRRVWVGTNRLKNQERGTLDKA